VISHSFAFNASRHLSILVSMLDLSPPLPVFLLLRVGGLSRLNARAVRLGVGPSFGARDHFLFLSSFPDLKII
jgi:hypothetical protein